MPLTTRAKIALAVILIGAIAQTTVLWATGVDQTTLRALDILHDQLEWLQYVSGVIVAALATSVGVLWRELGKTRKEHRDDVRNHLKEVLKRLPPEE